MECLFIANYLANNSRYMYAAQEDEKNNRQLMEFLKDIGTSE